MVLSVRVVDDLLEECTREALGGRTVQLPLDDAGIEEAPAVLDDRVAAKGHRADLGVDLDLADVRSAREGQGRRVERMSRFESGLHAGRQLRRRQVRLLGDLGERDP